MAETRFEKRYFEDRGFSPGLKGGDEVRGYGYYPDYFPIVEVQLATLIELAEVFTLLDVGCGKGALVEYARAHLGVTATGADVSDYATRQARRRVGGDRTVRAACMRLPFADAAFDAVWCNGVLQYLDPREAEQALEEIARVAARAAFVSNIAAAHRSGDWGRADTLTRLYLPPRQWARMAEPAAALRAWRVTPLPFEGESAILFSRPEMGDSWPARFIETSLDRMVRLGAIVRRPPGWAKADP